MKNELIIYHGSEHIIEKPQYGIGKPTNDYGLGFYCTEYLDLAKEWACESTHGGYANKYLLNTTGLKILDLNSSKFCIVHWISVLLKNRVFTIDSEIANEAMKYITENFTVNTEGYDVIKGYRADDSYFTYAKDFLQNTISVRRLKQVMKLGNLGNQIVLVSKESFSHLTYLGYEEAPQAINFPLRKKRDELARLAYLSNKTDGFKADDILMIDIIRGGMKADDKRLQ
ncbi:MAG: DUF3990 domain-containing protein [Clostridia bacterium]|nr:DUF3990 domain-containing protein [Clostridia bacterium]